MSRLDPKMLAPVLLAVLPVLACGGSGPTDLETARQDTFGFVYSLENESPGRSLHVAWSRGPLAIGRAEPFDEHDLVGDRGAVTEFWDGEVDPGDTAAAVIGYDGDPKPEPLYVCFSQEEGRPISCR